MNTIRFLQYIILVAAYIVPVTLYAGGIKGKVKGKDGYLAGVNVVATDAAGKTVAYCITDRTGSFTLTIPEGRDAQNVSFSHIGYSKKTMPTGKIGPVITMQESMAKLKEVKVRGRRIRRSGDTLTYNVSSFAMPQDRSIADVIAKMPGLEVKDNGQIMYQGEQINKFYIEGLDLMGSKYGVASKNISAAKVKSVQVYENHQAVKSLRGVSFSEKAALNIVLKEDAKAVWNANAELGAGAGDDFLYDCRLMGMRFTKSFQTLMMYKNNNTGGNISGEVQDLISTRGGVATNESGILSMMGGGTSGLPRQRQTFNDSHLAAGNWLWKTGKDSQLRIQGNVLADKTDIRSMHSTSYLTLDGIPTVTEEQQTKNTRSEWKGEANYEYNGEKFFVRNNIRGYIDFNKSLGTVVCNGAEKHMEVTPRKRSVVEDIKISHTTDKKNVYEIGGAVAYHYFPGQLLTVNGSTERLNLELLQAVGKLNYRMKMGNHYFSNEIGAEYRSQSFDVAMDEERQKATYSLAQAYWRIATSFVFGEHRIDGGVKTSLARQEYRSSSSEHVLLTPSLTWICKIGILSKLSANISSTTMPMMGMQIYDTPIFTSYRTRRVNRGETATTRNIMASMAYEYTNAANGLFFYIRPSYSNRYGNYLYETSLEDNVYTMSATDKRSTVETFSVMANVNKTVMWAGLSLGAEASFHVTSLPLLISGDIHDARMKGVTGSLTYSMRPASFISLEGKSSISFSKQENRTKPALSSGSTSSFDHSLSLFLSPAKGWLAGIQNTLLHSSEKDFGVNYFCDITLSYKTKRWEMVLKAANIIGTSEYERRFIGSTIETYSMTRLRPREVVAKFSFDI